MAELGGPTTQSGIFYQNTVAALYLGALLNTRPIFPGAPRVITVRVEAPEEIDDIVITHADGSRIFIQAKENLSINSDAWGKFWLAARRQAEASDDERDQFKLVLGTLGEELECLRDTLDRAQGKMNVEEWRDALNKKQKRIGQLIINALKLPDEESFKVVKKTHAEFLMLNYAEGIAARDWMPRASETPTALHSRLRDYCGRASRVRQSFNAAELSERLLQDFSIRVYGSRGDGLERYCTAIATHVDQIGVPGTSISVGEEALFVWPSVLLVEQNIENDFEDEDLWHSWRKKNGIEVDLQKFPLADFHCAILESPAGHGKSTVLRAVVRRLALRTAYVPVIVHAEELQSSSTIQDYLNTSYNSQYQVSVDWDALCEQGRAVVVIDGVDELNDTSRVQLVSMIGRLTAKYNRLPILVGARDSAMTAFPPQFKIIRLQRLDYDRMVLMLELYFRARGKFDIQIVVQHIRAYQELEQLCKIPLFLAIFVATLPPHGAIPTGRTEVLERYILHVLSPDRHKGVRKFSISKTQLRKGAEEFATLSLKQNEAGVLEGAVRMCLCEALGEPAGDDCVDALIQHGLIERRGPRLSFCIPTVQEYMAGCVIASTGRLISHEWTENIYRRPWAQAIQFAVERTPHANALLVRQLELPDDIFYTSLRLIARCIVNGAIVGSETKERVAIKLAYAWSKVGHKTRERISYLIADGFCRPMNPEIRRVLVGNENISFWRPLILVQARNNELTIECLRELLTRDDIRELWNNDWLKAISPVEVQALNLIIQRARSETGSTLSAKVIAEIVYQLRTNKSYNWISIASDESIPLVVRAAAKFSLPEEESGPNPAIIEAAFADTSEKSYLWESFDRAYTSTSWWKGHLQELFSLSPRDARGNAMFYLNDMTEKRQEKLDFLAEMATVETTHPIHKFRLQVLLGGFGYTDLAEEATRNLINVEFKEVYSWLEEATYFPSEVFKEGIQILLSRQFTVDQKVQILENMHRFGRLRPSGERKSISEHGPFTRVELDEDVADGIVLAANNLIGDCNLDAEQSRAVKFILAEMGDKAAAFQIKEMLCSYLDSVEEIDSPAWNSWVASAIDLILPRKSCQESAIFWKVLSKGGKLPMHSIVEAIVQREGAESYGKLVDYVNNNSSAGAWSAVYYFFEENAERKGLKLERVNGNLKVSTP